jgi:hypothetical protein
MTWWEYLRKEATDVPTLLLVAILALIFWATLWFTPALIDKLSQWYQNIASNALKTPHPGRHSVT